MQISALAAVLIVVPLAFATGCGANENVLRSGNETPIQAVMHEQKSSFERDLDAMRTAKFTFIYALRRRDGKTIDADDVRVIKQSTADTNRRVKTDDDRAVLIGSNSALPQESLAALNNRFAVEDHSARAAAVHANTNSNK